MKDLITSCCEFIKPWEGLRLNPYYDCAGFVTIGYGKLLSHTKNEPLEHFQTVTKEEAEAYLYQEVQAKLRGVLRLSKGATLTTPQLIALVDFSFNLGLGAYQSSTLRKRVISGDFSDVPYQLSKWNKAGGVPVRGLTRRRKAEAALFMS